MKRKKIAFFSTLEYLPWGGSEDLWFQAALMLAKDYEVHANVQKWDTVQLHVKELISGFVKVERRTSNISIFNRVINRIISPVNPSRLFYSWLDRVKPDLVIFNQGSYSEGADWMQACISKEIPFVNLIHGASEFYLQSDKQTEFLRYIYSKNKMFYFVSKAAKALTEIQLNIQIENYLIVSNPYKQIKNEITFPYYQDAYKVAFVGRLEIMKGIDLLIHVLSMDKWKSRNLEINLYGDGLHQETFRFMVENAGIKNILFCGFKKIDEIWKDCQILILPSRIEGLPLVIIEAMLAGRTVIATNVGGNSEVIDDNINGFIAKDPTVSEINEALERAWNRRNEWEEMGKLARAKMLEILPKDPVGDFCNRIIQNLEAN